MASKPPVTVSDSNLGAAVPKLKSDGLYPVCKQILQRFQMDVGQLPSEFD